MFAATDTLEAPWWTVESDDKRSSRLNTIAHLLSRVPYEQSEPKSVKIPDRPAPNETDRPDIDEQNFVPDHAKSLAG